MQIQDIGRFRESDAFGPRERLVLELAERMTGAPADVPRELMAELGRCFSEAQLVEIVATIAWENYRARFNRAFGVREMGFSDGAACALPEHGR